MYLGARAEGSGSWVMWSRSLRSRLDGHVRLRIEAVRVQAAVKLQVRSASPRKAVRGFITFRTIRLYLNMRAEFLFHSHTHT